MSRTYVLSHLFHVFPMVLISPFMETCVKCEEVDSFTWIQKFQISSINQHVKIRLYPVHEIYWETRHYLW